jgi:hypothetical protein
MLSEHSRQRTVIWILTCLLLLFAQPLRAQIKTDAARKFDEFGDIEYSDKIARLDNFAIQLMNEPATRGFIIVYRTRRDLPGLSNRYALWMKNYMMMTRGIPAERVVTVDGGVASCLMQELWIVPVGKTPAPRQDAYNNSFVDAETARKFDEHYYALPGESDDGTTDYSDFAVNFDAFATELRKETGSSAYLIGYAQYERDTARAVWKILRAEKNYLVKTYAIAPSRIRLVYGGYRNFRQVELWIVPRRADAPIPTPTRRSPHRKRR